MIMHQDELSNEKNMLVAKYKETLEEAFLCLEKNSEWEKRYEGYIDKIFNSYFPLQCKLVRKVVKIHWPFAAYLNISSVTGPGMTLDLRLYGTSVATLKIYTDDLDKTDYMRVKEGRFEEIRKDKINKFVKISFKDKESAFNELIGENPPKTTQVVKPDFICSQYWDKSFFRKLLKVREDDIKGKKQEARDVLYSWSDPKIKQFRSIVKKVYENNGFFADNEHAHESNILHLMNSKSSKYFYAMNPVLLEDSFFQMPTPFTASKAKSGIIEYSAQNGGGIDILARKKLGAKSELCVMEIKDQYLPNEKPKDAIKQAIVYSAFLVKLLKSDSGNKWFKYFGMKSSMDKVNINAVITMPYSVDKDHIPEKDTIFDGIKLDAGDGYTITLNYIYYDPAMFYTNEYDPDKISISVERNKEKCMKNN